MKQNARLVLAGTCILRVALAAVLFTTLIKHWRHCSSDDRAGYRPPWTLDWGSQPFWGPYLR